MKIKPILIIFIFCIMTVNNCTTINVISQKEESFSKLYKNCEMNSIIKFSPLQQPFRFENDFVISFENKSSNYLVYNPNEDLRIIAYVDGNSAWVDIKNIIPYVVWDGPFIMVDPINSENSTRTDIITPEIADLDLESFRVVVTPKIYENSTIVDRCVGAYIDIPILKEE